MQGEASLPLQRGCPRCGAPVPPENLELHLLRCQPAGVVGSVFGAAVGEQWPCSSCTFLNAEEQQCCAVCGGMRDEAEAQSPARGAAVLGSVFRTDQAEAAIGALAAAEAEAAQEAAQEAHGALLAAMRIQSEAAAAAAAEAEAEEHPSGAGPRARPHEVGRGEQPVSALQEVGRGGQPVSAPLREAAALHPSHEQPPHEQTRAPGTAERRQQARRYLLLAIHYSLLPAATPYCCPLLPTCACDSRLASHPHHRHPHHRHPHHPHPHHRHHHPPPRVGLGWVG
jgi:hypothetical protein